MRALNGCCTKLNLTQLGDDSLDGVFMICFVREKYMDGISVDVGVFSRVGFIEVMVFD
jgi:hypothetical protein